MSGTNTPNESIVLKGEVVVFFWSEELTFVDENGTEVGSVGDHGQRRQGIQSLVGVAEGVVIEAPITSDGDIMLVVQSPYHDQDAEPTAVWVRLPMGHAIAARSGFPRPPWLLRLEHRYGPL